MCFAYCTVRPCTAEIVLQVGTIKSFGASAILAINLWLCGENILTLKSFRASCRSGEQIREQIAIVNDAGLKPSRVYRFRQLRFESVGSIRRICATVGLNTFRKYVRSGKLPVYCRRGHAHIAKDS